MEKPWEKLLHKKLSDYGNLALGSGTKAWRHAETEHFGFHFHDAGDAQKVVRLAEYFYEQIKSDLGVTQDRFIRKNHVFIFADEAAWKKFLGDGRFDGWATGFAVRSELFLFNPPGRGFVTYLLAHEMTHCIFYRFVPRPIPLWLNEGFADFEAMRVIARSKGLDERRVVGWGKVDYPLKELVRATKYPKDKKGQFYAASERLVRFLITQHDRSKFLPLVNMLADGAKFEDAVLFIHHDKYKTFAAFEEAHRKFDPLAAWK
ncbi:MAG: hypothetical protein N2689_05145 [Verrucomicrobiae bacterium]|nr:hypothetical protein [Verrucomicrobiae bacterium]